MEKIRENMESLKFMSVFSLRIGPKTLHILH